MREGFSFCFGVGLCAQPFVLSAMAPTMQRMPLQAREVEIIRRLHQVIGLPVTKIALAVSRNKLTVYGALDKSWRSEKRGRKELLTMLS